MSKTDPTSKGFRNRMSSSWTRYPFGALPARNTGCQLFLPLPRNPRVCLVCGGGRPQHAPSGRWTGNTGNYLGLNGIDSPPSRPPNCSYDVRAEFVPKNSFKSKFGPRIPIVLAEDDFYVTSGQREVNAGGYTNSNSDISGGEDDIHHQNLKCMEQNWDKDMLKNPIVLSPSASSAFEEYRKAKIMKSKNSAESSLETKSENWKGKSTDDCIKHHESDNSSIMDNGHSSTSLTSELSQTFNGDYDSLPEIPPVDCLHVYTNRATLKNCYSPHIKSYEKTSKNDSCRDNVEKYVGSDEREIDKEIDKILGTAGHKLKSIEVSKSKRIPAASQLVVPVARKPQVSHRRMTGNRTEKLKPGPLMKSQSESVPAMYECYTLSIKNDSLVNKTIISIKGEDELRPHSAKPDFVPPVTTTMESEDSLAESSHRHSISPSPGRDLSDVSSNFSAGTRSAESDEPHGKQDIPKVVVKEVSPTKTFAQRKSCSEAGKVGVHFWEPSSEEVEKPQKKRPPTPPRRSTQFSHVQSDYRNSNYYTAVQKSISCSTVPQRNFDENAVDTRVCQHIKRRCPNPFSQQQLQEIAPKPKSGIKLSGLKKLLPKFETRSFSTPAAPANLRKHPAGVSRSSWNINTPGNGSGKSKNAFGGPGIKGLFHSVDAICSATVDLARTTADNSVIVTEILEPAKMAAPRQKQAQKRADHKSHLRGKPSKLALLPPHKKDDGLLNPNQEPLTVYKRKGSYEFKASTDTVNSSIFSYEESPKDEKQFHIGQSGKNLKPTHLPSSEKRKQMEDRYNQMALSHLSTLSFLAEYFEDLGKRQKDSKQWGNGDGQVSWSDFVLADKDSPVLLIEMGIFYKGIYMNDSHEVSPLRYSHPLPGNNSQPFFLPLALEFQDHIPNKVLQNPSLLEEDSGSESTTGYASSNVTLCRVAVLPEGQILTFDSFADATAGRHHPRKQSHFHEKETCFIMIQLLSCLKFVQSQGFEEVSSDLDCFLIIIYPHEHSIPHLVLLWESLFLSSDDDSSKGSRDVSHLSLCQCALAVLCMLLHTEVPMEEILKKHHVPLFPRLTPYSSGFQKVAEILNQEKASSLNQAKNLLDYMYWMADFEKFDLNSKSLDDGIPMASSTHSTASTAGHAKFDNEFAVRLWLDVERARTVNRIVRNVMQNKTKTSALDLVEQYRLLFLLNGSVKQLWEAVCTFDANHDVIV